MKKNDAPGYTTRRGTIQVPHPRLCRGAGQVGPARIRRLAHHHERRRDGAARTQPLDDSLLKKLENIGKWRPKSHGNYIPASRRPWSS